MRAPRFRRYTSKPTYDQPAEAGVTQATSPSEPGSSRLRTGACSRSQIPAPAFRAALVLLPSLVDLGHRGDLSHRYVPPALIVGHDLVAIGRNVDHNRVLNCPGGDQHLAQLLDVACADHVRPQALSVEPKVNRQHLAISMIRIVAERPVSPVAVACPKAGCAL